MKIYELKEFIQGANDCCRKYDAYIMGGNLKDGNDFSCVVSAIGTSKLKRVMRRKGACEGDFIISVGEFGAFWASIFSKINKIEVEPEYKEKLKNTLNNPIPRLYEGQVIARENLATSCMDNSDSIIACCIELAYQNNLNFILTITEEDIPPYYLEIFKLSEVNPLSAACSWGDWNLICTVSPNKIKKMEKLLKPFSARIIKIGEVSGIGGKAYYKVDDKLKPLNEKICSERFRKGSYFTTSIENYFDVLRNENIWEDI